LNLRSEGNDWGREGEESRRIGDQFVYQGILVTNPMLKQAAEYAETRGIIIADTKFEFGEMANGEIILIDEVLTPGSFNLTQLMF